MAQSVIIGTGSYIPEVKVSNQEFADHLFFERDGMALRHNTSQIIEKFQKITGISERRYAHADQMASNLGILAGEKAIASSGIDRESLDYIITAHNFGDVFPESNRSSMVPSLASRIKAGLKISNPDCIAYDLAFGCPGWLEGVIQANLFMKAGAAKRCMIIGTETLSRIIDPHDRDSMIYSDGSGAAILEMTISNKGVLSHKSQTYARDHAMLLNMGPSYTDEGDNNLYIKMNGRKVYEFALNFVPLAMKMVLDNAGVDLKEIKKILIHQANDKMDAAIVGRLYKLYGYETMPDGIMPMTIGWLGNSSVATIPTLLDLILKKKLTNHQINTGDKVIFASVGAGMNINAVLYQF